MASTLKKMEPFFPTKSKLPIHLAQLVLVIAVVALSGARLLMKNTPRGRSTTMGLGMVCTFQSLHFCRHSNNSGRQIHRHHQLSAPNRAC